MVDNNNYIYILSLSNNYFKKKIWLVIKSGVWHTACESMSLMDALITKLNQLVGIYLITTIIPH